MLEERTRELRLMLIDASRETTCKIEGALGFRWPQAELHEVDSLDVRARPEKACGGTGPGDIDILVYQMNEDVETALQNIAMLRRRSEAGIFVAGHGANDKNQIRLRASEAGADAFISESDDAATVAARMISVVRRMNHS